MNIFTVPRNVFFGHIFIYLNDVDHALLMATCRHFYAWLKPVPNGHKIILETSRDLGRILFSNRGINYANQQKMQSLLAAILWVNHHFNIFLCSPRTFFTKHVLTLQSFAEFIFGGFDGYVDGYKELTDDKNNLYYCCDEYRNHPAEKVPRAIFDFYDRYFPGTIVWKFLKFPECDEINFKGGVEFHRGNVLVVKVKRGKLPLEVTNISKYLKKAVPNPVPDFISVGRGKRRRMLSVKHLQPPPSKEILAQDEIEAMFNVYSFFFFVFCAHPL